jgi:hypothetical protein
MRIRSHFECSFGCSAAAGGGIGAAAGGAVGLLTGFVSEIAGSVIRVEEITLESDRQDANLATRVPPHAISGSSRSAFVGARSPCRRIDGQLGWPAASELFRSVPYIQTTSWSHCGPVSWVVGIDDLPNSTNRPARIRSAFRTSSCEISFERHRPLLILS